MDKIEIEKKLKAIEYVHENIGRTNHLLYFESLRYERELLDILNSHVNPARGIIVSSIYTHYRVSKDEEIIFAGGFFETLDFLNKLTD